MELNPQFKDLPDDSENISAPAEITPKTISEHFQELKTELKETPINYVELLDKYEVRANEKIPKPEIAWVQKVKDEYRILGTLGNFTLITGKAKSRKSFYINIAVSAVLQNDLLLGQFSGRLPDGKKRVLYFDTEQSKYHVQLALKRICKQIEQDIPENLNVYHLRKFEPAKRREMIEAKIYDTPDLGFVVIDGIRDLVTSINDESESTLIGSKLLKWTEEKGIHIVVVLHQNKGDNNARGHLGTELMNKAETVLSVTKNDKDKDISVVEPVSCRNREPEPFAFEIMETEDNIGIPVIAENFEVRTKTKERGFDITDLPPEDMFRVFKKVFSDDESFGYGKLKLHVQNAYKKLFKQSIGINKAVDLITEAKVNGWIEQPDGAKKPYVLGRFNEDDF